MEKLKKHKITIIIIVAVIVVVGALLWGRFGYTGGQSKLPYSFAPVTQGDFVRQIKLTGQVKAASDIQLSFAGSGKVAKVNVKAGDQVKSGQVIAELDKLNISADWLSAVPGWQSAQANLAAQKLKKQDLLNGAKSQDVAVSETQVASAQIALADAQTAANNVQAQSDASLHSLFSQIDTALSDSYNKSFDAVYHQTDPMYLNGSTDNPNLVFSTPLNNQAKSAAESSRIQAVAAVKQMDVDRKSLAADYSNYADVFAKVAADLNALSGYLNNLNIALSYTTPSTSFNQTQIDADKSIVSGQTSAINGATAALNSLKQAVVLQQKLNQDNISAAQAGVDQAQNALNLANGQLALKKSGSTTEELGIQDQAIAQAEAALNAAAANIDKAKAQLNNATIVAPIDGVITSVNLDPGEAVNASVPVIGLQSAGKYQIETFLPEIYVGEVIPGNTAKISFDAFGTDRVFDAQVISIDPAAQTNDNVLVYRTLLEFVNEEADIKTGLTANIQLITADDKNALSVPESSVIKDQEKDFVIIPERRKEGSNGRQNQRRWADRDFVRTFRRRFGGRFRFGRYAKIIIHN